MRKSVEQFATWLIVRFAASSRYELILNRLIRAADSYHQDSSHERGLYWIIPVEEQ